MKWIKAFGITLLGINLYGCTSVPQEPPPVLKTFSEELSDEMAEALGVSTLRLPFYLGGHRYFSGEIFVNGHEYKFLTRINFKEQYGIDTILNKDFEHHKANDNRTILLNWHDLLLISGKQNVRYYVRKLPGQHWRNYSGHVEFDMNPGDLFQIRIENVTGIFKPDGMVFIVEDLRTGEVITKNVNVYQ